MCTLQAGKVSFAGVAKDGLRHGYGVLTASNGDKYEGQFVKNARHGYGMFWPAAGGGQHQCGLFVNNKFVEEGGKEARRKGEMAAMFAREVQVIAAVYQRNAVTAAAAAADSVQ